MPAEPLPPLLRELRKGAKAPVAGSEYSNMIDTLREFLDNLSSAKLDDDRAAALDHDLRTWTLALRSLSVAENARMFGNVEGAPGRGQVMFPLFEVVDRDPTSVRARVMFGPYFLGFNGAAHGGAIALLFDEILGLTAQAGTETIARNANLHINFRRITPIERELEVTAKLVSIDGRKRIVRGEIRDGSAICADAEALFVELRLGQK